MNNRQWIFRVWKGGRLWQRRQWLCRFRVTVALLLNREYLPLAHLAPYEHPGDEVANNHLQDYWTEDGQGQAFEVLCVFGWRFYVYQDCTL